MGDMSGDVLGDRRCSLTDFSSLESVLAHFYPRNSFIPVKDGCLKNTIVYINKIHKCSSIECTVNPILFLLII